MKWKASAASMASAILIAGPAAATKTMSRRGPVKTGDRRSYAATYYHRHAAAAASSGYGCKPAARLTRSASLLMTHLGRRLCTAALRWVVSWISLRSVRGDNNREGNGYGSQASLNI